MIVADFLPLLYARKREKTAGQQRHQERSSADRPRKILPANWGLIYSPPPPAFGFHSRAHPKFRTTHQRRILLGRRKKKKKNRYDLSIMCNANSLLEARSRVRVSFESLARARQPGDTDRARSTCLTTISHARIASFSIRDRVSAVV